MNPITWLSQEIHTYLQRRSAETSPFGSLVRARTAIHIPDVGRLYALWAVAPAMGLRRGEALGLAWADVDFDGAG